MCKSRLKVAGRCAKRANPWSGKPNPSATARGRAHRSRKLSCLYPGEPAGQHRHASRAALHLTLSSYCHQTPACAGSALRPRPRQSRFRERRKSSGKSLAFLFAGIEELAVLVIYCSAVFRLFGWLWSLPWRSTSAELSRNWCDKRVILSRSCHKMGLKVNVSLTGSQPVRK